METSQFQSLSIESFSYRWLINLKPSLESLDNSQRDSFDASDDASFIEMDLRMAASKRFLRDAQDLNFDFSISQSPLTLVHADELFSNGLIMPLFVDPPKMQACDASYTIPASPPNNSGTSQDVSSRKNRCSSLRRCRRLSKRILQKYLYFLRPLYRRLSGHGSSSRVETFDTGILGAKSWVSSAESTPRRSAAYCADDWRMSCDSESSIYEAVLHCKRSIGK